MCGADGALHGDAAGGEHRPGFLSATPRRPKWELPPPRVRGMFSWGLGGGHKTPLSKPKSTKPTQGMCSDHNRITPESGTNQ